MSRFAAVMRQHWIVGYMGVMLLLGIVSIANLLGDVGRPFGGFMALRNSFDDKWALDPATPPWWPGRSQLGLRPGDELVTLNGQPYTAAVRQLYADAYSRGETAVLLTVRRGEQEINRQVPLVLVSLNDCIDIKLPEALNGLAFWLLAIMIYHARPKETLNRVFAVTTTLAAGSQWLDFTTIFPDVEFIPNLLHFVQWPLGGSFLGVFILRLFALFPEPVTWFSTRFWRSLYAITALLAVLHGAVLLFWWRAGWTPLVGLWETTCWRISMGLVGLGVMFFIARCSWLLSQFGLPRRLRRQLFILMVGLASIIPQISIQVLIVLLPLPARHSFFWFWEELDLRYLLLGVPLALAYIILRYKAFRSSHPLLLTVFMLISSALLTSVGTWLIRISLPQSAHFSLSPTLPILGLVLIDSFFWGIQGSWTSRLTRWLQWERHSLVSVRSFGQRLIGQHDLASLPHSIVSALVSELAVEQVAVWLWNDDSATYRLAGQEGSWECPLPPCLIPALDEPSSPLETCVRPHGPGLPAWLVPLQQLEVVEVIAPLYVSGHILGLLAMGKRWDEEIFDERDLEIIELISQQAALFLLTAQQVDALRQVPSQVAEVQERERFKIAQELHDTIQQFLGRLPFDLEVCRTGTRTEPDEVEKILEQCIMDVEEAAQMVRQIRNDLAPRSLEGGLSRSLGALLDRFSRRTGVDARLAFEPNLDLHISMEARQALYRVIQQALDNISAHAHAHHAKVSLTTQNHQLHLVIVDDGVGFSAEQKLQAQREGSFGLKSMEARVTSLGGGLQVVSLPGAGTQIIGWLPIFLNVSSACS